MEYKSQASNSRSSYQYTITLDDVLVIMDNDRGMSVTNNMENVLNEIQNMEGKTFAANQMIIYKDTSGQWDGVEIVGKRNGNIESVMFLMLACNSMEEAIEKIKGL